MVKQSSNSAMVNQATGITTTVVKLTFHTYFHKLVIEEDNRQSCNPPVLPGGPPCLSHPSLPQAFGKGFVLCVMEAVHVSWTPSHCWLETHSHLPWPVLSTAVPPPQRALLREPPSPAPKPQPLCSSLSPPGLAFSPSLNQNSSLPSPRASKSAEMGINTH